VGNFSFLAYSCDCDNWQLREAKKWMHEQFRTNEMKEKEIEKAMASNSDWQELNSCYSANTPPLYKW
jgi:hypothetical protein